MAVVKKIVQRKLVVSMNITLDGFLSGPACELDWHFNIWTTDMAEALCEQLAKADTLLFGRVTYVAMANYWTSRAMDLSCPDEDRAFVHMMNSYRKIVFTNTLTNSHWHNSRLVNRPLIEEVNQLKEQVGSDIMVYGSSRLVKALISLGAIDEFHLWVHPVTIGNGKPLFQNITQQLRLVSTQTFRSGVVLLVYRTS